MRSRAFVVAASLVLLALSGCGSRAAESAGQSVEPSAEQSAPTAAPSSPCVADGVVADSTTVATPDLDGDDAPDEVREARTGECRGTLLALVGGEVLEVDAARGPTPTEAYGVALGDGRVLLVTRQVHPRGGFQVRVHAADDGRYVELTSDSQEPLLPFVATDTVPGTPVVAECTEDGVRVLTASLAHGPPEEVSDLTVGGPSWHVVAADYRVEDGRAVAVDGGQVAGPIAPERFAERYPDLAEQAIFADCRTRG